MPSPSTTSVFGASTPDQNLVGNAKNKIYNLATPGTITTQNPASRIKGDTIEMSPLQWMSTYDDEFQKKNPQVAALNKYYNPYQSDRSMGYLLGQGARNLTGQILAPIGQAANKGPLWGGLAAAVPGLLIGSLGTGIANLVSGKSLTENMFRNSMLAALLTGGLGAYSGYLRKYKPEWKDTPQSVQPQQPQLITPEEEKAMRESNRRQAIEALQKKSGSIKFAFSSASEAQAKIVQLIQSAPGLSFNERSQLMAGVAQLSSTDLSQLASSLTGVGGAAVGAIIARYLLNKGLIGTVLGAIFGSNIAKAVFGPTIPRNDLGQPSLQGRYITGQYF